MCDLCFQVPRSILIMRGLTSSTSNYYKASKRVTIPNYLTEVPCGMCPLKSVCSTGGVISPSSCQYYNEWLGLADVSTDW